MVQKLNKSIKVMVVNIFITFSTECVISSNPYYSEYVCKYIILRSTRSTFFCSELDGETNFLPTNAAASRNRNLSGSLGWHRNVLTA